MHTAPSRSGNQLPHLLEGLGREQRVAGDVDFSKQMDDVDVGRRLDLILEDLAGSA